MRRLLKNTGAGAEGKPRRSRRAAEPVQRHPEIWASRLVFTAVYAESAKVAEDAEIAARVPFSWKYQGKVSIEDFCCWVGTTLPRPLRPSAISAFQPLAVAVTEKGFGGMHLPRRLCVTLHGY